MPTIDTSKIEGFDSMTAEEKLEAVLKVEVPEAVDLSKYVAKDIFDKKAYEAENLAEQLSIKYQQLQDRIAEIEKREKIAEYKSKYLEQGYGKELATAAAPAVVEDDMSKFFESGEKSRVALDQKTEEDLSNKHPKPDGAGGGNENEDTSEERAKARVIEQRSLDPALVGYTVDIVFCIDATGSMEDRAGESKVLNMVKQNALNFYGDFSKVMAEKGKTVRQLRVRIVAFRDYMADGEYAMMVTGFFRLPQQKKEFEACINSIHADGGGDIPEDGLEALAYAIRSEWTTEGARKRQIIVVWTDADAHPLGYGGNSGYYPKGMPANLRELTDWWDNPALMNQVAKRLILFAPDTGNWKYISDNWNLVWHCPSVAGMDLLSIMYYTIEE